ncbi:MAG: septal ring lytic transglycosylase RlpA family protein [Verrucomicrobiae bacterium]|nr:septal ring lytic transglycosylase RlpA family protein [Verrucomicrobiae bacterium]
MTEKWYALTGLAALAFLGVSCQSTSLTNSDFYEPARSSHGETQHGSASWYSVRTNGRRTASGVPLSDHEYTAAHRSLPFGTLVKVTNQRNGRSQIVRITDRGPYIRGRIIDVSKKTADELDMVRSGVIPVEIEVLRAPNQA